MEKAGVGVSKVWENPDRQPQNGPTQLHHLLELVKEEQNIFNIVFHEIIRQVSHTRSTVMFVRALPLCTVGGLVFAGTSAFGASAEQEHWSLAVCDVLSWCPAW